MAALGEPHAGEAGAGDHGDQSAVAARPRSKAQAGEVTAPLLVVADADQATAHLHRADAEQRLPCRVVSALPYRITFRSLAGQPDRRRCRRQSRSSRFPRTELLGIEAGFGERPGVLFGRAPVP